MGVVETYPLGIRAAGRAEAAWFFGACRARRIRGLREFVESEIIIPDGPYKGRKFKCGRQPYSGLFFDAVDSGLYNRFWGVGPVQSGKTLSFFVAPALWHLCEWGHSVVLAAPSLEICREKIRVDLKPAMFRSRYRDLWPTHGPGSKGGKFDAVTLTNGAVLKLMGAGGGDEQRSHFTAPVVLITEVDKMDESGLSSRETNPIDQVIARTSAFGSEYWVYGECTASIETGRIWMEYESGSHSRIVMECVHCGVFVGLEREHFSGYKDAVDILEARERSAFYCASCGAEWSEGDRRRASQTSRLLHGDQTLERDDGGVLRVVGEHPRTTSLGFRWSAVDNQFQSAGDIGEKEYRAQNALDEDDGQRGVLQFTWACPDELDVSDLVSLDVQLIIRRQHSWSRGVVPEDTEYLTVALDLGKWTCWWSCVAHKQDASPRLVDYGQLYPESRIQKVDIALRAIMEEFREVVELGWPVGVATSSERRSIDIAAIDSGWKADVVYDFVKASRGPWRAFKGFGESQSMERKYVSPKKKGSIVRLIGEGYHESRLRQKGVNLIEANADYWKSFVHDALETDIDKSGAMTLFRVAQPTEHFGFAKHILSERQFEEFVPGVGPVKKWEQTGKNNHWFDTSWMNCCAGHMAGARSLVSEEGEVAAVGAGVGDGVDAAEWLARQGR